MTQPLLKESRLEVVPPPSVPSGIGATLRSLREARRLSPGEVSARLKFTSRQLEALETEQWDRLPTGVSLRGFVKNYGRFLEADVDALLVMLDSQVGYTAAKPVAISRAGSLGPADLPIHGEPVHRPWGWLIIILVLLFVAGFYAIERGWVPDSWLVFDWLKSLKK
ncbi:helix-turn-helix domain-containing protein [Pollutimonas bauzanensis]|uniref:Helix-turn-helix domain-containing protein n=1 Tax=Pollutimonas bauzanensis TaxID=658167 RepID=A0A1M5N1M1_9BURK|nr:helix-turn-helix transcriptional regulator [Pollutimonas bauzanensis]SHG83377.1 Helix-turn-helix domain-containing protein [Pollutimonas bauzanensis]